MQNIHDKWFVCRAVYSLTENTKMFNVNDVFNGKVVDLMVWKVIFKRCEYTEDELFCFM